MALLGLRAGAEEPSGAPQSGTVELQLLGLSDLHGHLEPPEPGLGGVAWLGAWLDRAAAPIRAHDPGACGRHGRAPLPLADPFESVNR